MIKLQGVWAHSNKTVDNVEIGQNVYTIVQKSTFSNFFLNRKFAPFYIEERGQKPKDYLLDISLILMYGLSTSRHKRNFVCIAIS